MVKVMCYLFCVSLSLCANEYFFEHGERQILTPIVSSVSPTAAFNNDPAHLETRWYATPEGNRIGVTQSIIVKWRDGSPVENILADLDLTVSEYITDNITSIEVPVDKNVFELSRILYNSSSTLYAHPNTVRPRSMR